MKCITPGLTTAAGLLLGASNVDAQSVPWPWVVDLGAMSYMEEGRNRGVELIARGKRELDDGSELALGADIDVITGATPNGATPSNRPQTFTKSSGDGFYQVAANELPADDTHMDTRMALSASLKQRHAERLRSDLNGHLSMEFDYLSLGLGGGATLDFNDGNTELSAALNLQYDMVHPVGSVPDPFASMQPAGRAQARGAGSLTKNVDEIALGLVQVINRQSLLQLRLTYSHMFGYLTDPYKLLSLIEVDDPSALGETTGYLFERRPDNRYLKSVYVAYKRHFDSGILDLGLRAYSDSWDLRSETLELAYRFFRPGGYFIRPGLRLYHQQAASFYRHSLPANRALPEYASADVRLATFDGTTLSIEYGRDLGEQRRYSVGLEFYTQQGEDHPADAVGIQRDQDLFPDLKTVVLNYSYSMPW
jgi:hypothetical protein